MFQKSNFPLCCVELDKEHAIPAKVFPDRATGTIFSSKNLMGLPKDRGLFCGVRTARIMAMVCWVPGDIN